MRVPRTRRVSIHGKASTTAAAAASEVATVRLTTQLLLDGRLPLNYAEVTISASEDALSSIEQTFSVVEPPDGLLTRCGTSSKSSWATPPTRSSRPGSRGRRDDRPAMPTPSPTWTEPPRTSQAAEETLG